MDDYEKYLKYKKKYLELRRNSDRRGQSGGANGTNGTSVFPLEDETQFWGRQMTEHALFLFLGLEDGDHSLKKEAFEIHREWKQFMKTNFWGKGIEPKPDLVTLSPENLKLVGTVNKEETLALIDRISKFQQKIIDILNANEWIGWIFPSLALHMEKETEYFRRKLQGPPFTVAEEIAFSNTHHSEEIGTTAHLLDPAPENLPLHTKAMEYSLKTMKNWSESDKKILQGMDVTEQATLLRLSIKYGQELTQFAAETGQKIDAKQLKSIISPVLAHHVHREFARLTMTLQALKA